MVCCLNQGGHLLGVGGAMSNNARLQGLTKMWWIHPGQLSFNLWFPKWMRPLCLVHIIFHFAWGWWLNRQCTDLGRQNKQGQSMAPCNTPWFSRTGLSQGLPLTPLTSSSGHLQTFRHSFHTHVLLCCLKKKKDVFIFKSKSWKIPQKCISNETWLFSRYPMGR